MSEGAGLYVHVPFCDRACPYCDFDFEAGRGTRLEAGIETYLDGIERELDERAQQLGEIEFDTLYIGGGTPSTLGPEGLARLFARLFTSLDSIGSKPQDALREWTVELNPEHASPELFDLLAKHGVDRVSLGVQTLATTGLRQLGRAHERSQALAAVTLAHDRGLRTSVDLIVGWPGQSSSDLERDLDEILATETNHLSVYALTIEADTPWPRLVERGIRELPDEDAQADLLAAVEARLCAEGFVHYEVASYGRAGAEAIHNGKYWRWVDVVGLGPSAASVWHDPRGGILRRTNSRGLGRWAAATEATLERLSRDQAAAEGLWLGIRQLRGLDLPAFLRRFGVEPAWVEDRVRRQIEIGNLEWIGDREGLRVRAGRWLWHDTIAVDLMEGG